MRARRTVIPAGAGFGMHDHAHPERVPGHARPQKPKHQSTLGQALPSACRVVPGGQWPGLAGRQPLRRLVGAREFSVDACSMWVDFRCPWEALETIGEPRSGAGPNHKTALLSSDTTLCTGQPREIRNSGRDCATHVVGRQHGVRVRKFQNPETVGRGTVLLLGTLQDQGKTSGV